jgi:hypothetical protein
MDINESKNLNKGDKVSYCPMHGAKENGIVKEVRGNIAFVVYKCGEDWVHYEDYTGAATNISDLKFGWI